MLINYSVMKRYRVLHMDFDVRANLLALEVQDSWDPRIRERYQQNKEHVRQQLRAQYGSQDEEQKARNFLALGAAPFSVIFFHNAFYRQVRDAFILGAYYPALTGVCALGERVLNHVIHLLREDFQHTPEYKQVYRKDSFGKWDLAIKTLENWAVLLPETVNRFRELRDVRNRALHFNPETERDTRDAALSALKLFHGIVENQFAAFGKTPWYIPNDLGISFVRKAHENHPFVARVVLPSCAHVGPAHDLQRTEHGVWTAVDPAEYPERDVSDEEFIELFKQAQHRAAG